MIRIKCLYVDLRTTHQPSSNYYHQILSPLCEIRSEKQLSLLPETIRQFNPKLLIFEYDHPDPRGLQALQQTKISFPSLPILMITDYHSEELSVWAFRSGVRDYLTNPVNPDELISRVERLTQLATPYCSGRARDNRLPIEPIEENLCPKRTTGNSRTAAALDYIEAHLQEKLTLAAAARYCGISLYRFSHLFRQEQGIPFQELLLRKRIRKAQKLLNDTDKSVTEIAYSAGFSDLSYFIRTFKRYAGISPTAYRLLEESLCTVFMCVPPESTSLMQQAPAQKPTADCRLCENWACTCWSSVHTVEKKALPVRQ